jgi:rod shape-determining protein MreC
MENFFTRYRNETVLFGILFIQIIALAVQVRVPQAPLGSMAAAVQPQQPGTRLIRVWATTLISPFQKLTVHSGEGVRGLWRNYVDLVHVRQQNIDMKQEIDRLRLEKIRLQQDAEQGQRLQGLLGFKEQYLDQTVAAQVIGTSGTDLSRVIYVDRGTRDGVGPGMAVITPDGIVGKVSRADRTTSQVLLITDPMSGAGVLLERLRLNGILKGTLGGYPEVLDVMADEKVQPGDTIVTTGGDRVFPKGLPVGTVTSVFPDRERDPFLAIRVKPTVNLGRLEEVLIVTKVLEQQVVTDSANGPVRAADVLAQRLPSAKKKSVEEVAKQTAAAEAAAGGETPAMNAQPAAVPPVATPSTRPPSTPDKYSPPDAKKNTAGTPATPEKKNNSPAAASSARKQTAPPKETPH